MDNESRAPGRTWADVPGDGRPRLVISQHGSALVDQDPDGRLHLQQVVQLEVEIGTRASIGGDDRDDVRLDGLGPAAVVVALDTSRDEFVVTSTTADVRVNGAPLSPSGTDLHTGDRVSVGDWSLSFARDEFADHGRPHGGRQGGELSHQLPQDPAPGRG